MEKKQARSSLRKAISIHGDAEEIIAMKEALSDFIAEFTVSYVFLVLLLDRTDLDTDGTGNHWE